MKICEILYSLSTRFLLVPLLTSTLPLTGVSSFVFAQSAEEEANPAQITNGG